MSGWKTAWLPLAEESQSVSQLPTKLAMTELWGARGNLAKQLKAGNFDPPAYFASDQLDAAVACVAELAGTDAGLRRCADSADDERCGTEPAVEDCGGGEQRGQRIPFPERK